MDWLAKDFADDDQAGFVPEGYLLPNVTGYPGNWSFLNFTLEPDDGGDYPDLYVDQTVIHTLITLSMLIIFIMIVSLAWFLIKEYKPWNLILKRRLLFLGSVRYTNGSSSDLQGLVA